MCNISICVPVYGVEKYIERCARSLFEQSYSTIEYIFVDDCSLDKSIDILMDIIEQYPQRKGSVRIIKHAKNRGLAAARNTAVENCCTDFLMHVDSDDWIDSDAVERLMKRQQETNADIVTYDVKMHFHHKIEIRNKPQFYNPDDLIFSLLHKKINSGVWGALIRVSLYKSNGIYVVEGINMSEDFQVYPRLAYYANCVTNLNDVYYHYNFSNQNSYTHNETINTCRQTWKTYEILEDFFSDKNPKYIVALKEGMKKTLARELMSGCLHQSREEIFSVVHQMLDNLVDIKNNCLKIQEIVAIKIPFLWMLRGYIYILLVIKRIISIK